jgi:hypothetical protein
VHDGESGGAEPALGRREKVFTLRFEFTRQRGDVCSGPTPRNHNLSGRSVSGALLHSETKERKKPRFRSLSLGVDDAARRPLFCIDIVVVNIKSNA